MKKCIFSVFLVLYLLLFHQSALAAKARGIVSKADSDYHQIHLTQHIGATDCRATGNYLKVRSHPKESSINGRLEQADGFTLLDIHNGFVLVEVFYADSTSPKSFVGLRGWVDAKYIDCSCDNESYHRLALPQTYEDILRMLCTSFEEEWNIDDYSAHGIYSDLIWLGRPSLLHNIGYHFQDINYDGVEELLIGFMDNHDDGGDLWLLYTLKDGQPKLVVYGMARSHYSLRVNGTLFNEGSNGAGDHGYQLCALSGGQLICLEGVRVWLDVQDDPEYDGYFNFIYNQHTDYYSLEHPISKQEANKRIASYSQTIDIPFIPLSHWQ